MKPSLALALLAAATPLSNALQQPAHNRRVVAFELVPSPIVPGTFHGVAVLAWARVDGSASDLDLSTDVQLLANGAPTPGLVQLGIAFGPTAPVCTTDGCLAETGCATISIDGQPLLGTCRVLPPHPGDDAPSCGCTGIIEVPIGQQLELQPGDELELVLTPAPGAAAEIFTADDTWRATVPAAAVSSYCEGDQTFSGCPCVNVGFAGQGCRNSTGSGALQIAIGSTSAATDDLRLRTTNLPPLMPLLSFAGTAPVNGGMGAPFGDGLRCAGGIVRRLGTSSADAAGVATFGPGLIAANGWVPGDTRFVQSWYRDPGGPCGSGFNLSNALEVLIAP